MLSNNKRKFDLQRLLPNWDESTEIPQLPSLAGDNPCSPKVPVLFVKNLRI